MRTFQHTITAQVTASVPDNLVASLREDAQSTIASGRQDFVSVAHQRYPEDDEAFIMACINSTLRIHTTDFLRDLGPRLGIGLRVAPAVSRLTRSKAQEVSA